LYPSHKFVEITTYAPLHLADVVENIIIVRFYVADVVEISTYVVEITICARLHLCDVGEITIYARLHLADVVEVDPAFLVVPTRHVRAHVCAVFVVTVVTAVYN